MVLAGSALALEINVLRPAPDRQYIWCLQSPFDNRDLRGNAVSSPTSFARITLVGGTEAYVVRFARKSSDPVKTKSNVEGFPDITYAVFDLFREAQNEVYLLDDALNHDGAKLIEPNSRLADELRLAYAEWKSGTAVGRFPDGDYFSFILEPLLRCDERPKG